MFYFNSKPTTHDNTRIIKVHIECWFKVWYFKATYVLLKAIENSGFAVWKK